MATNKKRATATTNDRIRKIFDEEKQRRWAADEERLTYETFAELIGVSAYTVRSWFRNEENKCHRAASVTTARLIEKLYESGEL